MRGYRTPLQLDEMLTARRSGKCFSDLQPSLGWHFDIIVTDPPYYEAIPYSDLMDFFYVWLRRILYGLKSEIEMRFNELTGTKVEHDVTRW